MRGGLSLIIGSNGEVINKSAYIFLGMTYMPSPATTRLVELDSPPQEIVRGGD
jgi:hypothetical protein